MNSQNKRTSARSLRKRKAKEAGRVDGDSPDEALNSEHENEVSDSDERVEAVARVDARTKNLLSRVRPGEIAVIDHEDLDRIVCENLVRAEVAAVVNAASSISGRYPNLGPLLIAAAGIPLIDNCGPKVMTGIKEGRRIKVQGGGVFVNNRAIAYGKLQTLDSLEIRLKEAKASVGVELEKFVENTLEYMRAEREMIIEGVRIPDSRFDFRGRQALIVVRGYEYREDLHALLSYVRDLKPILIAVDGGADALLDQGLRPDIIIGDFDSVSDAALHSKAELIVHAFGDGRAPGAARLDELGLEYLKFTSKGTSEDIAMLLAHEKGAELIVALGTHASLVEFLDKGRAGMASTFLTRLRVGPVLVDAKGVNRLYKVRLHKRDVVVLILAALFAMLVVILISQSFQLFLKGLWIEFSDFVDKLVG